MLKISARNRIIIILIMLLNIANGFVRYSFVVNFSDSTKPFIIPRKESKQLEYPQNSDSFLHSIQKDIRWLSSLYYTIFAILSTLSVIYLMFSDFRYVKLALVFYGIVLFLMIILVGISFLTNSYGSGYGLAQNFKNLMQTPFFSFVLIGGMLYFKHSEHSKGKKD